MYTSVCARTCYLQCFLTYLEIRAFFRAEIRVFFRAEIRVFIRAVIRALFRAEIRAEICADICMGMWPPVIMTCFDNVFDYVLKRLCQCYELWWLPPVGGWEGVSWLFC